MKQYIYYDSSYLGIVIGCADFGYEVNMLHIPSVLKDTKVADISSCRQVCRTGPEEASGR